MISQDTVRQLLETPEDKVFELFEKANKIRLEHCGKKVFLRGVIEFSNMCKKNCYYCGIRSGNRYLKRYLIDESNILDAVKFAKESKIGSIVLQSGEIQTDKFADFVDDIVREIKKIDSNIEITLSLGEQSFDVYKRWFESGASRYLLRIESSSKRLYQKWHPLNHSFERRLKCLEYLKEIGYQTGTGVLIGVPYQTISDLVKDILFFKEFDIDMIGMGPYVIHKQTPFGKEFKEWFYKNKSYIFLLSLKMIAVTRIILKDVNIASTTALDALNNNGRVLGLKAGANVIMPDITPSVFRGDYSLYENKPSINLDYEKSLQTVLKLIDKAGFIPGLGESGTSIHYLKKHKH